MAASRPRRPRPERRQEETQLLEAFQRLQLADRRSDVSVERFGAVGVDADVQPDGDMSCSSAPVGRCGISRFEK